MEKDIRILLVDDHQVVREGLQRMLEQEEDMEVVGQSGNAEEALLQLEVFSPNIVLMDIKMPEVDGIELTRQVKEKQPCNVIMLTLYDEYLAEAFEAGAAGYLLKDTKRAELTQAIRQVHQGEVVISESISSEIRDKYLGEKTGEDPDMKEVRLVIPPIEANHLIRFISQVEEMLECSVQQVVSSWQEGTAIILSFKWATSLADILNKLAEMPEVEAIVENPPPRKTLLSLLKKDAGISRRISPKTILVTPKRA